MNQPIGSLNKGSTKIRLEFTDTSGAKYSINIDQPSKDNLGKLLDFVGSISTSTNNEATHDAPIDTNFARVYELIETRFKFGSFHSNDVLEAYEHEFHFPSSLSIISTYLARLANRGLLTRSRSGLGWTYKLVKNEEPISEEPHELQPNSNIIPR